MASTRYLALFAVLALPGCADPHQPLAPDFGQAVRANIAAQLVNPDPAPDSPGDASETDGRRMRNAIRRYQTNTVYPPQPSLASSLWKDNAPSSNTTPESSSSSQQ